uniref:Tail tubular protein A n=1 Tax=uncultured marine virus TaxID=186617 RepID=A0A0F7L7K9_9VIRU|nr:tail tubular protein A [uncultured marine virus]
MNTKSYQNRLDVTSPSRHPGCLLTDLLAPVRLRHLFTVMRFAPRQLWKKLKVTTLIEPSSTTTTLLHASASIAALTLLKRWLT